MERALRDELEVLWERERGEHVTAIKEMGSQFYNCKELDSINNLNDPANGFFPEPPNKTQDL